jgi:hypothetical protein
MSRNRFCELHRFFHISPPVPAGVHQIVVQKTGPFYQQRQTLFKQCFVPGSDFTIDETMIAPRAVSIGSPSSKLKPEPIGYKIYTVASDGYLLGFRIFRGKGGFDTPPNVLHHTVIDLVQPWGGVNRTLYFDNLYTPPALCDALLGEKVRSCGTCRPNRKGYRLTSSKPGPHFPRVRPGHGSVVSCAVSCGMTANPSSSYPPTCGPTESRSSPSPPAVPPPPVLLSQWTTT